MSGLTITSLLKRYPGMEKPALDHVDLKLDSGTLVTVLGPSGCGKTTLLRLVTGFLRPDAGTICIGDEDVTHRPAHKRDIGMVYQNYALWPHMTVQDNVAFGLEMRRMKRAERAERVGEALELVGLGSFGQRYPSQLSGGQAQRVAIARALVIRPRLLLMDEPLSSLDAKLRMELRFQIRSLQKALGVTTLFVTHDQEEALTVSDSVVLMRDGRLVQEGPGESLYRTPVDHFAMTFMGEVNVLAGSVAAVTGDQAEVRTDASTFRCTVPSGLALQPSDEVQLGLRPEYIGLARDATPDTVADGIVETVAFVGPWVRYKVRVGDVDLLARRVSNEPVFAEGERVHLSVPPESIHVVRLGEL